MRLILKYCNREIQEWFRADMGKLRPAGQVRPAGPFILACRHLHKLKFFRELSERPFFSFRGHGWQ